MREPNLRVLLASRPNGSIQATDFRLEEKPAPSPGLGEVLFRNRFLSIDPYMRVRMNEGRSYAQNIEIGDVMVGDVVGDVVESRHPDWKVGDQAVGRFGWQRFFVSNGEGLRRITTSVDKPSVHLGVLGMPGVTAWYGLLEIGKPKAGETVVVAAASGAVGSVVGQIAKLKGCRVIGIAGGEQKCRHVVVDLGFDECVDHRAADFPEKLAQAVPNGIDVYFDTVGGVVLNAVLKLGNPFSRIALCGMITDYNNDSPYGITNLYSAIANRTLLQGFIVSDHASLWPHAVADLDGWVRSGVVNYRETIAAGLEQAPLALIGLLRGQNIGKQLVRID